MEARPGEPYQRILLDLLMPIGDTLFATPAIRSLRRAYPSARLTALVTSANRAVLENNPDVDELVPHFHPEAPQCRRTWPAHELARSFAALRMTDLLVSFAPYHDMINLLVGAPRTLRLPCPWLFWLVPHANRRWRHLHARDHYLEVLRPLGLHRPHDKRLVLNVGGRQEAFAARYLARHGHRPGELLVGMHAGAAGFRGAKRWSPEGFAYVARELAAELPWGGLGVGETGGQAFAGGPSGGRRNVRLVFFGGPKDRELARAVVEAGVPDGFIDTSGQVSLSQTIGILSQLDLFVGNDSGPLHLAAALGVPSVGVYGPTSVLTYHPIGPHVRAVYGPVPCPAQYGFIGNRPLWQRRGCEGECLDSVPPEQVAAAAQELLAKSRCHPEERSDEGSCPLGTEQGSSLRSE